MSMLSISVDPSRSPRACLCSSSSSTMRTSSSSSSSSGRHMNMNMRRGKSRNTRKQYTGVSAAVSSSKCLLNSFLHTKSSNNGSLRREQQQQQQQQHYGLHRRQETKLYAASSTDRGLDGTASTPPPSASVSASASAAASPATEPPPPAAKPKKKGDSLEAMRKFSEQYAKRSNTYFCVDKGVTAVVIKGLAEHKDELGAPLCPCRHYDDKAAEVADGFWNCPCVPMRERHECHCMLFLTPDNDFAGEEQHITRDEIDEGTGGR